VPNGPKGPLLQPPLVHPVPGFMRPLPPAMHAQPVVRPLPIVIHPVIRPLPVMPRPGPVAPGGGMQRFPQWQQFERPSRPVVPNAPAPKPK
ncbi:MAG TPA: hypothetical protein VGQ96_00620, partial [Candidatus Eremiobacteraceae bacterium]|nr:hypothetical protein [Candidatus Eremiobacteraceae bacterium]